MWVQTLSGRMIDLNDPDPASIDLDDVATALSRIVRFNGHTRFSYSVAQHCMLGSAYLHREGGVGAARRALLFLLHDAHEAFVGDIATPVAAAVCDARLFAVKYRLDRAIWKAATGRDWTSRRPLAHDVADVDLAMLRAERDQLCVAPPQSWGAAIEAAAPVPVTIHEMSPVKARALWLAQLSFLREA